MNREIKFRIWLPSMRSMGLSFNPFDSHSEHVGYLKESVFMQYTGLKDKNGVEIYEGDILARTTIPDRYVVFKDGGFQTISINNPNLCTHINIDGFDNVIGNIYQNPELLKTT